ncbi:MAG: glycosyltransferase family 2 protein [Proteobacteria bacterium]|nr:glycosyltransferase family 2 protein [Pseudomonadota bacterium]
MSDEIIYSVVVPVFNEETVLSELYLRLTQIMDQLKENYEIILVNDGSTDSSLEIMRKFHQENKKIKVVDFSRNFGHQVAITAGTDYAVGKAVIIIDADLQDSPEVILQFVKKWKEGYEVVYGVREKREKEMFFKKLTAKIFYHLFNRISELEIPVDTGDFRLIDKKVVNSLKGIREKNRFVRGLTIWIGFNQTGIRYHRAERYSGYTKYPLKKMFKFALDAVFSFSKLPLRLATYSGFTVAAASCLYLLYVLFLKLFTERTIQGWTLLVFAILFLGSVQLICLGIIGEYLGRISDEIKNRPLYVVRETIGMDKIQGDS